MFFATALWCQTCSHNLKTMAGILICHNSWRAGKYPRPLLGKEYGSYKSIFRVWGGDSGLQGGEQSRAFISNTDKEFISNEKRESLGKNSDKMTEYLNPVMRRKNSSKKAQGYSGNLGKNSLDISLKKNGNQEGWWCLKEKVLKAPAQNQWSPHSGFVIYLILHCFNCKDGMQGVNTEAWARWERAEAAYAGTAAKRNIPQNMALLRCLWGSHWKLISCALMK